MEIQLADLPEEVRGGAEFGVSTPLTDVTLPTVAATIPATIPDEGLSYEAVVATVERELLLKSLKKTGGNKVRAAKLLQMKRTTFAEKLKRLQPDSENDLLEDYQAS